MTFRRRVVQGCVNLWATDVSADLLYLHSRPAIGYGHLIIRADGWRIGDEQLPIGDGRLSESESRYAYLRAYLLTYFTYLLYLLTRPKSIMLT